MLTRFVRNQLIIFAIASVIGMSAMVVGYLKLPVLLGIGRITVTLELPYASGLYRFANVTYRGVEVGKVTDIQPTREGVVVTMSLQRSAKVPADLQARVRSVSAVGEQYVDLVPRTDDGPYLQDGAVISAENASLPQRVGPMLDQLSALVDSIPRTRLSSLLDESFKAFNGTGNDLGTLFDSSSRVAAGLGDSAERARRLIDDAGPVVDGQAQSADAIRTWARSLAGITATVVARDPEVRTILRDGDGAADAATRLMREVEPTLPVLLANLTTVVQVAVTYQP
ncbi:MAG: MCE family protein, partial [Mycolicibacterium hassiacum]